MTVLDQMGRGFLLLTLEVAFGAVDVDV